MKYIKYTHEQYVQALKDKDIPFTPITEYKGSETEITCICNKCGNEITRIAQEFRRESSVRCPHCYIDPRKKTNE